MKPEETLKKPNGLVKPVSSIGFFAERAMFSEGQRIAGQVRLKHLERQGRRDTDTERLLELTQAVEDFVDGVLKRDVLGHPTAAWWSRITGCHKEIMGKILGAIEQFGRFYEVGDPMIPADVNRPAEKDEDGVEWVWVEGIERLTTPSKLVAYAGYKPDSKRTTGQRVNFNTELKTILYRLSVYGFMMKRNRYYDFYAVYKQEKTGRLQAQGVKILPTPKGRFCPSCREEQKVPRTTLYCPVCNTKLGSKEEPPGVIWEGHLDMMGRRRMIKLFLTHLWVIWRDACGLPTRMPYPMEYLVGHTDYIDSWQMCDLPAKDVAEIEAA